MLIHCVCVHTYLNGMCVCINGVCARAVRVQHVVAIVLVWESTTVANGAKKQFYFHLICCCYCFSRNKTETEIK